MQYVRSFSSPIYIGTSGGPDKNRDKSFKKLHLNTGKHIDTFYISKAVGKDENEIRRLMKTIPNISPDKVTKASAYLRQEIEKITKASH